MLYFDRRIFRSEIAYRISCIDKKDLINVINKWFINKKMSVTLWGNVDEI